MKEVDKAITKEPKSDAEEASNVEATVLSEDSIVPVVEEDKAVLPEGAFSLIFLFNDRI